MSASSKFQAPKRELKIGHAVRCGVFLMKFKVFAVGSITSRCSTKTGLERVVGIEPKVFGNRMKHCLECYIFSIETKTKE